MLATAAGIGTWLLWIVVVVSGVSLTMAALGLPDVNLIRAECILLFGRYMACRFRISYGHPACVAGCQINPSSPASQLTCHRLSAE